jgi:hypothetical protein
MHYHSLSAAAGWCGKHVLREIFLFFAAPRQSPNQAPLPQAPKHLTHSAHPYSAASLPNRYAQKTKTGMLAVRHIHVILRSV